MATDLRGHTAPAAGEQPRRSAINDLSLSINDAVMVANTVARQQLVTDLAAAGVVPSTARPLLVFRADVARYEFTTVAAPTASDWQVLPSLKAGQAAYMRIRRDGTAQTRNPGWGQVEFNAAAVQRGEQPWTYDNVGFTVTQAGLYQIDATVSASMGGFALQIFRTGDNAVLGQGPTSATGTGYSFSNQVTSGARELAAGDRVITRIYPLAALNVQVDTTGVPTFMSIRRID